MYAIKTLIVLQLYLLRSYPLDFQHIILLTPVRVFNITTTTQQGCCNNFMKKIGWATYYNL